MKLPRQFLQRLVASKPTINKIIIINKKKHIICTKFADRMN